MESRYNDGIYCRVRKRIGRLLSGIHVCLRNIGRTVRRLFYSGQGNSFSDFDIESSVPSSSSAVTIDGFPTVVRSESCILEIKETETKISDDITPEGVECYQNENDVCVGLNVPSPIKRHSSLPVKLSFQKSHKARSLRFKNSLLKMVRFGRLTKDHRKGKYGVTPSISKSSIEHVVPTNFKKICSEQLNIDSLESDLITVTVRPFETKRKILGHFQKKPVCETDPNECCYFADVNTAPESCEPVQSTVTEPTDCRMPLSHNTSKKYVDGNWANDCDTDSDEEMEFYPYRTMKTRTNQEAVALSKQTVNRPEGANSDTKDDDTASTDSLLGKWLDLMSQHGHKGIKVITPRKRPAECKRPSVYSDANDRDHLAEPNEPYLHSCENSEATGRSSLVESKTDVYDPNMSTDIGFEEEDSKEFKGTDKVRKCTSSVFKNDETAEVHCPFGIGTHYRMDDHIDTQRCKRGAKLEQNIKQKVKRRGIPNKHLAVNTDMASAHLNSQPEVKSSHSSDRLSPCHSQTNTAAQIENFEGGDEIKGDTRHMDSLPAFVITKKKQEEDEILQQYTVTNKNKTRNKGRKKNKRNAPTYFF